MAARTPHQRLTPFYEEMRERTMDRNGVHIVYPPMENEYVHYDVLLPYNALRAHEYFSYHGSHVILSVHFGSDDGAEFPISKGLDSVISGVVVMEPGSYAVYSGVYTGPDVIRVNAPGAVSDLGKPEVSGIFVKIGVRKNLKMYVFFADYGKKAVMAPFGELISSGHEFVPRFSMNFNVRHVLMESYY
ncbi:uncharacterized protein [Dermacentor andersoni]|uniref:uncharacterized protein isoform X1 n=2 Tax=Dermacentor andersoni TaxID=34620 RepID=UPI002417C04C|nr:uncharacterized protein LOC129387983 isoform X1 [Dermacentor andersoni]